MAESITKYDPTWGIDWHMVEQVEQKRYQFHDPCIICGQKFNSDDCIHLFGEVQRLIERIKKLTVAQKVAIYRRDKDKTVAKTPAEQADELVAKANEMLAAAEKLRNSFTYPTRPDWVYGSIRVNFRGNYRNYTYLVYMPRSTEKIWTTGTVPGTKEFENWEAFVDWLRGDDVQSHGLLIRLKQESGETVDLP